MKAKAAFENHAKLHGVKMNNHHEDDGIYANTSFLKNIAKLEKTISCGKNAHFQNGVAEKKSNNLKDHEREALLHAIIFWAIAITAYL